ncbi:hypothetical protein E2C01_048932 [Portunus trituberculatus]|uniref:Uncharacterized protein n=1 Tax=Portunus trituberculatus TaxID=210409 RepID=A0A5B7G4Y5_PORTR|nr:hypothetical protein [Portunus trituberculatus]
MKWKVYVDGECHVIHFPDGGLSGSLYVPASIYLRILVCLSVCLSVSVSVYSSPVPHIHTQKPRELTSILPRITKQAPHPFIPPSSALPPPLSLRNYRLLAAASPLGGSEQRGGSSLAMVSPGNEVVSLTSSRDHCFIPLQRCVKLRNVMSYRAAPHLH